MKAKRTATRPTTKTRRPVTRRRAKSVKALAASAPETSKQVKRSVGRSASTVKAKRPTRRIRKRVPLGPENISAAESKTSFRELAAAARPGIPPAASSPMTETPPEMDLPVIEKPQSSTQAQPVSRVTAPESGRESPSVSIAKATPAGEILTAPSLAEVASNKLGVSVPSILLEGDEPVRPQVSGPGRKFEIGAATAGHVTAITDENLPEAYGTGRLWLVARDPHCLYAHWDLDPRQQREFNAQSIHQHLLVRVYRDHASARPLNEIHVHPESRHWFLHVEFGGAKYIAELGIYSTNGHWQRVALSDVVETPSDAPHRPAGVAQFATIIFEPQALAGAEPSVRRFEEPGNAPLLGEPMRTQPERPAAIPQPGMKPAPAVEPWSPAGNHEGANILSTAEPAAPAWTAAQSEVIAEMSGWTAPQTRWLDSLEITELVRGVSARGIPRSQVAPGELAPSSLELGISSPGPEVPTEVSSPFGGELPGQPQFWFNVNAELVIYGATEPGALVTIGNRRIRLRPDGTFSYRFALPDGTYDLPITAMASHGDSRHAHLRFHRGTSYSGEVGVHPQDPALRTPEPRHVA